MRAVLYLIVAGVLGGGLAFWLLRDESAKTVLPPLDEIDATAEADAAKGIFEGELGDFLVLDSTGPRADEAFIYECQGGEPYTFETDQAVLQQHELWSPGFGSHGLGVGCEGEGLRFVNNSGQDEGGDRVPTSRAYFSTVPVPVLSEAPRDRLELIEVEGHPALIERSLDALPYPYANLTVIERYPDGDVPGILVRIETAPSSKEAIALAEDLIP